MTPSPEDLVRLATEAAGAAYAPYSKFLVGAALCATDGRVFTAGNVENASYGLTICAERAAVFKAVSDGQRSFAALAISVPGGGPPCGACRQVLREFAPSLPIYLGDERGKFFREVNLELLLPDSFGPESLGG